MKNSLYEILIDPPVCWYEGSLTSRSAEKFNINEKTHDYVFVYIISNEENHERMLKLVADTTLATDVITSYEYPDKISEYEQTPSKKMLKVIIEHPDNNPLICYIESGTIECINWFEGELKRMGAI